MKIIPTVQKLNFFPLFSFQDPAGIFELIEVVGNGTYGQVYKVCLTIIIVKLIYYRH